MRALIVVSIVNVTLALAFFGSAAYAVFEQNRSPWWFAVAIVLYVVCSQSAEFTTKTTTKDDAS